MVDPFDEEEEDVVLFGVIVGVDAADAQDSGEESRTFFANSEISASA